MSNTYQITPGSGDAVSGVELGGAYTSYAATGKLPGSVLYVGPSSGAAPAPLSNANPLPVHVTDSTLAATQSGSWAVTANAGTNLNTSLLALESGGHLASLDGKVTACNTGAVVLAAGAATIGAISNTSFAATQSGTWNVVPAGSVASGATDSGNPVKVGGVYNSSPITLTTGQRGDIQLDSSGFLKVNVATGGGSGGTSSTFGSAFPGTGTAIGAKDSSGVNLAALNLDASGFLKVNVAAGSGGNGAASATGSAIPAQADYAGLNVGGTLRGHTGVNPTGTVYAAQTDLSSVGGTSFALGQQLAAASIPVVFTAAQITTLTPLATITANAGTGTFAISAASLPLPSGAAADATLAKLTVAQGASLGSNTQALMGGSVTTAAPTYTTGQISPFSLTTAGSVRVDGSGATQPVSGTITANAGTNLNTSLLALETGGNLATLAGAVTSSKVQANVAQVNGVTPLMGNGVTGTGSQRVTIASDNTAFSVNAAQSGTWNIATVTTVSAVTAITNALPAGTNLLGKVGIDQTTPGTTNAVSQPDPAATTGSITAVDAATTTTAVSQGQSFLTGTPTANSSVSAAVSGAASFAVQLTGTWVGTVAFEKSSDGGTTWIAAGMYISGSAAVSTATANGLWFANAGATTNIRVRCTAYTSGTVSVRFLPGYGAGVIGSHLQAGTNLAGVVIASHQTGAVYNGTTSQTPQKAFVTATASGNTSLVAAVSAKKIYVLRLTVFPVSGAVNVKFQSATTDITPLAYLTANQGFGMAYSDMPHFETVNVNEALNVNLSTTGNVGVLVTYLQY